MARYGKKISVATLISLTTTVTPHAGAQSFDTIINVPPDVAPSEIGSNTQLNVFDGGMVGDNFVAGTAGSANTNIEVNVLGGSVGTGFDAHPGSEVTISGGSMGNFDAFGSVVTISGGSVGENFHARDESVVTISGGSVGEHFRVQYNSVVTISGGSIDKNFHVRDDSEATISGGSIGDSMQVIADSLMTIMGGSFQLDGVGIETVALPGQSEIVDIPFGVLFTGVLADGTPFAFHSRESDFFDSEVLRLSAVELPPVGPALITGSTGVIPMGIREGQTLVLDAGSVAPDHFNAGAGSTVEIQEGSVVGENFEAVGATVTITGGSVGDAFDAFAGSKVTISGGSVGNDFTAGQNSEVTISGGSIGNRFDAGQNSEVTISGGSIGNRFDAGQNSEVTISGGSIGNRFDAGRNSVVTISGGTVGDAFDAHAVADSEVTIMGGSFQLDGVEIDTVALPGQSAIVDIPRGVLFTGVLADGTPFAFHSDDRLIDGHSDVFDSEALRLTVVELPLVGPALITGSTDPLPLGIREGQTVVLDAGSVMGDHFNAGTGSTVEIHEGAVVGENLEAVGATVTISGGMVGDGLDAFSGSHVTISGGDVGGDFDAHSGSQVTISGGHIGPSLDDSSSFDVTSALEASDGSEVTMTGGSVGSLFFARPGSKVTISGGSIGRFIGTGQTTISGGTFGDGFGVGRFPESTDPDDGLTLVGGAFQLDGVAIDAVVMPGQSALVEIPANVSFSGVLADGTPFAFHSGEGDVFASGFLRLSAVALPAIGPALITGSTDSIPQGIREGQTLILDAGSEVSNNFGAAWGSTVEIQDGAVMGHNFEAVGATVRVTGGTVGRNFGAFAGSHVTISGGSVGTDQVLGSRFRALAGSEVAISGGTVGRFFEAHTGSVVTISGGIVDDNFLVLGGRVMITGGTVGSDLDVQDGSIVTISGGTVGSDMQVHSGGEATISGGSIGSYFEVFRDGIVTISGGTVGDNFDASDESTVNLVGLSFILDGVDISNQLPFDELFTVEDRDVSLSGLLADGSPFSFDLNTSYDLSIGDFFSPDATLTLRLVPEPGAGLLALLGAVGMGGCRDSWGRRRNARTADSNRLA